MQLLHHTYNLMLMHKHYQHRFLILLRRSISCSYTTVFHVLTNSSILPVISAYTLHQLSHVYDYYHQHLHHHQQFHNYIDPNQIVSVNPLRLGLTAPFFGLVMVSDTPVTESTFIHLIFLNHDRLVTSFFIYLFKDYILILNSITIIHITISL